MIKCKLISPTNLMLEHPLFLSPKDETEFCVLGRKEYDRQRLWWIQVGVLIGIASAMTIIGIFFMLVEMRRG